MKVTAAHLQRWTAEARRRNRTPNVAYFSARQRQERRPFRWPRWLTERPSDPYRLAMHDMGRALANAEEMVILFGEAARRTAAACQGITNLRITPAEPTDPRWRTSYGYGVAFGDVK